MNKPLFSILHTSARPDKWFEVYQSWMARATHPELIEYVLAIDPRWGFSDNPKDYDVRLLSLGWNGLDNLVVVQNTGRRCYVDGVNCAAKASTGSILIVNADDMFPPEGWDRELLWIWDQQFMSGTRENDWNNIEDMAAKCALVLEVDSGTPNDHERSIMPLPVLSRKRYEDLKYVFYPEYESMCADNDFCEQARLDKVVIDARHIKFEHRHPLITAEGTICGWKDGGTAEIDLPYLAQNSPDAGELGQQILSRRRAAGFKDLRRRSIALCLSGERFEGAWVDALLMLYGHLINLNFNVMRVRADSATNVYEMREGIRRAIFNSEDKPQLCLWLDDDNILRPDQFDQLLADIDAHPEVDGIFGWCWIHSSDKKNFKPSVGEWAADRRHWVPFLPSLRNEYQLKPFETGGFPCALMRLSALEKAGDKCFVPVLDDAFELGFSGEDTAFFLAAEAGGAKFMVDPQIRVPHLKYVEMEPVFPEEGRVQARVAGMLRVRNEARWIRHCIESIKPLCDAGIYILEDGSTDDTRRIALECGAIVIDSPFADTALHEGRDKDWLLQEVIARANPDWILMPDGDEMLEPGGVEKIRYAIDSNPPVDCFALRFLHLWDSPETARFDGVYGSNLRQSLFRASTEFRFRSYYGTDQTPNDNHVGIHTSNAPGFGGRVSPLNVILIHFGPMWKEDRIRKYEFMIALDGKNEGEDFYRHMVQGDLPQFPADAKFKQAGPLDVRRIAKRLVPKFPDGVPGPRDKDWMRDDLRKPELVSGD